MGRELKRVPKDLDYQIGKVWQGYCPDIEVFQEHFGEKYPYLNDCNDISEVCKKCGWYMDDCSEESEYCFWHNPTNREKWFKEVPDGEGYQLWCTTSEGKPISPVFETLDELCEWAEPNATTFGYNKATKEQWKKMLDENFVYHEEGNCMYI